MVFIFIKYEFVSPDTYIITQGKKSKDNGVWGYELKLRIHRFLAKDIPLSTFWHMVDFFRLQPIGIYGSGVGMQKEGDVFYCNQNLWPLVFP